MTLVTKILFVAALCYVAIVGALAYFQDALVFPRHTVGSGPSLPAAAQPIALVRDDGVTLRGVRIPGRDPSRPALLGFPGNAWNARAMALFLHQIAPDREVFVYHYRGYTPSDGQPAAQTLMADAVAIHDQLDRAVIAVGFSIGSGIAAHLAGQRAVEGVILATPFDSLRKVAQTAMPFAPVRWLFRHEMPALRALQDSRAPLTLILATEDRVIPRARSEALANTFPEATAVRLRAGHNDIYNHPEFAPTLRRALR